ncbi:DUF222 domain-containing protein, partial [Microbispora sp. GKU 823]|uniref:DUF222 domain-containing protein n=1 Tax=Microbispora sp. GKU 823 TaxID=1652100 RepID=UPI0021186568
MFARDRITCALADRVGRVHGAGQARQRGHASTRSWLRTAGGMSVPGAGRLLTVAVELARLPRVRAAFAEGRLSAGVVEAICTATAELSDEQAGVAEPILLELAGKAGPAEVAKAGRYLRAVLDPDGEERDEQADYARRFLRVRPTKGGGLEGEFHLPREAAARLRALLDAYAKPRAEGDDRPLRVRNADAFIALLEQEIATELLILVNAESLPTDPEDTSVAESGCTPSDTGSTDDPSEAEDAADPGDLGAAADSGTAEAEAEAGAEVDVAAGAVAESADRATTAPRDEESGDPGASPTTASPTTASPTTTPLHTAQPDPPPDDPRGHHTHAGHRPAGDCRHGQATREDHGHENRRHVEGGCACGGGARCSSAAPGTPPGSPPGAAPWTASGTAPGASPGAPPGVLPGALLGTAPGLLLATGQMLPISSVHRLARTSTLVRLVMDADGQVL